MDIKKAEFSESVVCDHLINNVYNGNYKYISCVKLYKCDINKFKNWLSDCENLNQDYFFMFTETSNNYRLLCGCSTFRIAEFGNSTVSAINMNNTTEAELKRIFYFWYKYCRCFVISDSVNETIKNSL